MRLSHFVSLAFPLLLVVPALASDCARLGDARLAHTTITAATVLAPGTFRSPYGDLVPELPSFCRVTGVIRPSSDSEIRFEVWMPETGWNGKYLGVGNGGFAGTLEFRSLGANLKAGFATGATDTGHQGEASDAAWAYKHPEKVVDFGWRALHLTTENAKQLIAKYYGSPAKRAYFDSCSNGGREALIEAQRFPDDFDGILAGAPANDWTDLMSEGAFLFDHLKDPAAYISGLKLPAISDAVLAACGSQSGAKDGFVNDPPRCNFNPDLLLCKDGDELTCLTKPQLSFLKSIYAGAVDAQGRQRFPGHSPGGELGPGGWGRWILGGAPGAGFGSDFYSNYFRYVVFDDPAWNPFTGRFETDLTTANRKTEQALNATNPDLHAFQARGGKLILYHGWSDPAIPPQNTINYYNSVRKAMGFEETAKFVRLYMVPGMQHCGSGPGPNAFGQQGLPATGDGVRDALQHWVESGDAPQDLIVTKYVDDRFNGSVQRTRPLCAYPKIAKYKGSGDPNDASNFVCATE
ncbi:MAG TPA: tannase/feruloyl esterase family alpha/beta hydrolase [Bryobacteraceae bacterium]|nr:tannase/feruloyl esterase family alpha/beta hydrolase [Bryobacteraceae bacterium]